MNSKAIKIVGVTMFILLFCTLFMVKAMQYVQSKMTPQQLLVETWYFTGGNPEMATNYSKNQNPEKPCDNQKEVICSIQAPADPLASSVPYLSAVVPQTSQTVLDQIKEALQALTSNVTVTAFRAE